MDKNQYYRMLPQVDKALRLEKMGRLLEEYPRTQVRGALRAALTCLREKINEGITEQAFRQELERLDVLAERELAKLYGSSLKKVINATGAVLHTNLGRACLSEKHFEHLKEIACGYCNLEYSLKDGARGERYSHFDRLICTFSGAEAAMAVNNNAAAVLLMLSALCRGKEVIVSRGELVEIGGKFRMPDVIAESGAKLIEVGTTNKTHPEDYLEAVTEHTAAILKVHRSNFTMKGFCHEVSLKELREICDRCGLLLLQDLGSGALLDMAEYGMAHEPTVRESITQGADVVAFSGDKLLGGPQAGMLAGKSECLNLIKKHPLTRALRIDKLTAALLEMTLLEYLDAERACKEIPTLSMLAVGAGELKEKAELLAGLLRQAFPQMEIELKTDESVTGGGVMPEEKLPTVCVCVQPETMSAAEAAAVLRQAAVPVIVRIAEERLIFDVRTVAEKDFELIAEAFYGIAGKEGKAWESR